MAGDREPGDKGKDTGHLKLDYDVYMERREKNMYLLLCTSSP